MHKQPRHAAACSCSPGCVHTLHTHCAATAPHATQRIEALEGHHDRQLHVVYLANDILFKAQSQRPAGSGPEAGGRGWELLCSCIAVQKWDAAALCRLVVATAALTEQVAEADGQQRLCWHFSLLLLQQAHATVLPTCRRHSAGVPAAAGPHAAPRFRVGRADS